ncbi:MAG: hypothetical protein ACR2FH_08730, partial [Caulobacteraceae bacterium]
MKADAPLLQPATAPAAAVDPPVTASVPAVANPAFAQNKALDGESARRAKVWFDQQLACRIRPPRYLV